MANIEKRINKQGKVTSYRISVTEGVDRNGNPIRRRMTWTPEPGMTEKQIEKALQAAALTKGIIEKKCDLGRIHSAAHCRQ